MSFVSCFTDEEARNHILNKLRKIKRLEKRVRISSGISLNVIYSEIDILWNDVDFYVEKHPNLSLSKMMEEIGITV